MRIEKCISVDEPRSVRILSEFLAQECTDVRFVIRLADVGTCPNRVVPIVGLADCYRRGGKSIEFETLPYSAASRAVQGFSTGDMSPVSGLENPFGRVWRFGGAEDQGKIVNAMVLALDKRANLAKGIKQGFEWCLNEVMDNVLNHSRPDGDAYGYVMVQHIENENMLKVCVFDTGIGLPASFSGSRYSPANPAEAIALAVQRGVTNGKGQGNGLWGLHELVKLGRSGRLYIRTAGTEYLFDPSTSRESMRESWTLEGFTGTTLVDFQLVCSDAASLEDVFGGPMGLTDLWQEERELPDGSLCIRVAELASSFGSRPSAREVRHVIENAIDNDGRRVMVDFTDVGTCSSSFVDELVGKLLVKYGFARFSQIVGVRGLRGFPEILVNHSIAQRLAGELVTGPHYIRDANGEREMGPTGGVGALPVNAEERGQVAHSSGTGNETGRSL